MSITQRNNQLKLDHLRIDYVSLFKFWKRLTPFQADIFAFETSTRPLKEHDVKIKEHDVKTDSLVEVKSKLTIHQRELIKTDFFMRLRKQNLSRASNRKIMLDLQDQLETGLINSVEEFESGISHGKKARQKKGIKSFNVEHSGSLRSYDIFDVPEHISRWRSWKLVQSYQSAKCFYTGEECIISERRQHWEVSEEHLIPQIVGGKRGNGNNVVAANWVNNILGGAPVHVKANVKMILDGIICHPKLTLPQRKTVYELVIKQILDRYKVHGRFPWNDPPKKNMEKARRINKVYELHRQAEKKFIDEMLGESSNIAVTLKEITDGMDKAYYESI